MRWYHLHRCNLIPRELTMSPRRAGALPLLLRLDPKTKQPLNQQIYQGLRLAILDGRLRVGARLPSSRMLATDLSISRNTVLNAYERLAIAPDSGSDGIEARLTSGSCPL